ncbi:hypothetical protein RAS1_29070 [Phycisphaerae bacterium RAS1]|nr:hypothetical protein RAS1_29070 [Phycisphaerae bacterium RAS1]
MSVTCLNAVYGRPASTHGEQAVLCLLSDVAGDDPAAANFCRTWMSVPTIARQTRLTDRAVRRILARLAAAGEITVHRAPNRGPRTAANEIELTRVAAEIGSGVDFIARRWPARDSARHPDPDPRSANPDPRSANPDRMSAYPAAHPAHVEPALHISAERRGAADAADWEPGTEDWRELARLAALRASDVVRGLPPGVPLQMVPLCVAVELARDLCGVDSSFADALTRHKPADRTRNGLLKGLANYVRQRAKVRNPAAWLRRELERRGVRPQRRARSATDRKSAITRFSPLPKGTRHKAAALEVCV